MDWLNPVEWFSWIYGKAFQNHVCLGGAAVVALFAFVGLVLWIRGVDKYREEHPKMNAATSGTPSASTPTAPPTPNNQGTPNPPKTSDNASALPSVSRSRGIVNQVPSAPVVTDGSSSQKTILRWKQDGSQRAQTAPPVAIDNAGTVSDITLEGGTLKNRRTGVATRVDVNLKPWFDYLLEMSTLTKQDVEDAIAAKQSELSREGQRLPPEVVLQLRKVENDPEKLKALLATWSAGHVPQVVVDLGGGLDQCSATLDTSTLVRYSENYKVAIACFMLDPKVDMFEDERIAVSSPFTITGGTISILVLYQGTKMEGVPQMGRKSGNVVFLFPKDEDVKVIKRLSDVKRYGGIVLGRP